MEPEKIIMIEYKIYCADYYRILPSLAYCKSLVGLKNGTASRFFQRIVASGLRKMKLKSDL